MDMLDIKTGKPFSEPSARSVLSLLTRRKTLSGLAGILATSCSPSLLSASTGRGMMRGLGMRMAAMGGGEKPYDAEIEYLGSSGTQYVDTFIRAKLNTEARLKMEFTGHSGNCAFGYSDVIDSSQSTSEYKSRFTIYRNWLSFYSYIRHINGIRGSRSVMTSSVDLYVPILADMSFSRSIVYYGETLLKETIHGLDGVPEDLESERTIKIFAGEGSNSFNFEKSTTRFYYVDLLEGENYIRRYIPVRVGTVGYMYDRANPTGGPLGNGLYPNAGTGSFILGPDKV